MDVEVCRLSLWHWGREIQITDEKSKMDLKKALDGTLKRRLTGDWLMKSGGSDWVLKISDGKKQLQISIYPGSYQKIKYRHYDYTLEKPVSVDVLKAIFDKMDE